MIVMKHPQSQLSSIFRPSPVDVGLLSWNQRTRLCASVIGPVVNGSRLVCDGSTLLGKTSTFWGLATWSESCPAAP